MLEASPTTRIVVFSGFEEQGLVEKTRELGASAFIEKSTSLDMLIERLAVIAPDNGVATPVAPEPPSGPAARSEPPRDLPLDQRVLDEHLERFREVFEEAVNGPLGELSQQIPQRISVEQRDGELVVTRPTERGEDRALHGLTRTLVANMVEGVTKGFEKALEIQGVGYRAGMRGTDLELNVGYSHPVVKKAPQGITFEVPQPTQVVVKGIDKQQVGQIAAEVRAVRPPEPYKGKGIRYAGEYVRRKVGKRA